MPDIAILKDMISPKSLVSLEYRNTNPNKTNALLEEKGLYSVSILGLPDEDNAIVFKVDDFPAPLTIFKGNKGECKRADYVIIANTGIKKVIVIIELKSAKLSKGNTSLINQLKGASCVVKYSQEVGKIFWDNPHFLDEYEYRFVCLKNIRIAKKPTSLRTTPGVMHDSPNTMLKINSPPTGGLQFNKII